MVRSAWAAERPLSVFPVQMGSEAQRRQGLAPAHTACKAEAGLTPRLLTAWAAWAACPSSFRVTVLASWEEGLCGEGGPGHRRRLTASLASTR